MDKQVLSKKDRILMNVVKIIFCIVSYLYILYELTIIDGISNKIYNLYYLVMLACLISFALTVFQKFRKIAYIVFVISLGFYCYMHDYNKEIVEQHNLVNCLEVGKVYDPNQKNCRDDCWKWDDKLGCLKE